MVLGKVFPDRLLYQQLLNSPLKFLPQQALLLTCSAYRLQPLRVRTHALCQVDKACYQGLIEPPMAALGAMVIHLESKIEWSPSTIDNNSKGNIQITCTRVHVHTCALHVHVHVACGSHTYCITQQITGKGYNNRHHRSCSCNSEQRYWTIYCQNISFIQGKTKIIVQGKPCPQKFISIITKSRCHMYMYYNMCYAIILYNCLHRL